MQEIFYVDDDIDDLNIFSLAVKKVNEEAKVSVFTNADAFFKSFSKKTEANPIVFLDINVPGKNGFFILKDIRSDPNRSSTPVIMYSTSSDEKVIATAKLMGADHYMVKPGDFKQLTDLIKKVISMDWSDNRSLKDQKFLI